MTKREFIERAGKFAAVGVSGAAILAQLQPNYALAQQVPPDDPAIATMTAAYDSPDGNGRIKRVDGASPPLPAGKLPAVLVVAREPGAQPLYRRCRAPRSPRPATSRFGPDGLSPLGGYPGNDEQGQATCRSQPRLPRS